MRLVSYPHKSVQLSVFVINHSLMHEKRMVTPMEKLLSICVGLAYSLVLGNSFSFW